MRFLLSALFSVLVLTGPVQAAMEDYPSLRLRALDKSTARTSTMEVAVGDTVQYGSLYIKVQACRQSDPLDKPESAAFLQVWELPPEETESRWVFSGWMFASSPALSAMDHPVYDVWVLGCTGRAPDEEAPSDSGTQDDGQEPGDSAASESGDAAAEAAENADESPLLD